jgi:hypothetical protein
MAQRRTGCERLLGWPRDNGFRRIEDAGVQVTTANNASALAHKDIATAFVKPAAAPK